MSSYINFKNVGDLSQPEGSGAKSAGNFSLAGQSSFFSLTFDELQNTFSGAGKDFGSMNMDELLKNIWTADGTQPIASSSGFGEGLPVANENLQKQGSLTLPRTLSQKTVDEVLKDLLKEGDKNVSGIESSGTNLPQRQGTLGEMTLEEFLFKAGVTGEATLPIGGQNNGRSFSEISQENNNNNNNGLAFGFQQPARNHASVNNQIIENNNAVPKFSTNLAFEARDIMAQQVQQQQPLFPKQATVAFSSPNNLVNSSQLASSGTRAPAAGRADHSVSNSLIQSRVIPSSAMGMANLTPRVTPIAAGSPKTQLMPNIIPKSDVDTSSLSPSPYAFNEGARGRKANGSLEKVVERRRRRMIKNRESAARSRARKQAYTLELEAEVEKLKEVIADLEKKQQKVKDVQKCQVLEKKNVQWENKRLCLRRTLTGPW